MALKFWSATFARDARSGKVFVAIASMQKTTWLGVPDLIFQKNNFALLFYYTYRFINYLVGDKYRI